MSEPRRDACRSCGAPILFARTGAGKLLPIDPDPHDNGNVALVGDDRCAVLTVEARRAHKGPLYRSHFVTCSSAAAWRKGKRPAPTHHEVDGEAGGV